mmetsp:Transcript_26134/g.43141  ORF Transcript_26134/g.43141 Transcript_26134/m.43141 type:complete len:89 (-) Transcript_26134:58-324(-)
MIFLVSLVPHTKPSQMIPTLFRYTSFTTAIDGQPQKMNNVYTPPEESHFLLRCWTQDVIWSFLHDKDKQRCNSSPNEWNEGDPAAWFE